MKEADKLNNINRYESRLKEFGYDPQSLDLGIGKQEVRFSVLARNAMELPESSVLDIGCGFADLYAFLKLNNWKGKYTGVDLVPGLINEAQKRNPGINILTGDITDENFLVDKHDFVIASGVMNEALPSGDNKTHIRSMLENMFRLANKMVCVDFMTTNVDFQKPDSWHTDPSWILKEALALTPRVTVRNDYMRYEFAIFLYKNIAFSKRNVFEDYEKVVSGFKF